MVSTFDSLVETIDLEQIVDRAWHGPRRSGRKSLVSPIMPIIKTRSKDYHYKVTDSKDEAPSKIAIKYVQQVTLGPVRRGVILRTSYDTFGSISSKSRCPLY